MNILLEISKALSQGIVEHSQKQISLNSKKRLAPICHRTLRRQVLEYIRYTSRIPMLHEFYPSTEETELYNLVTEFLSRNRLISIRSSQRSLTTLVLRKLLASSTFA